MILHVQPDPGRSPKIRKDQNIRVFSSCQLHRQGIAKAWRLALDPELKYAIENVDHLMKGMKRAGQMPAEGGEHALRTVAEKIFQACMSKETEQISLDCLDPRTPAMLEKFKDLCEERFGSLQDAFEKVDVDGVGIVSREDFRMLCHEVKATDGIFRLMEFLDPKRTGEIRLSLIDGEVVEDAMLATQTRRQMQQNAQAKEYDTLCFVCCICKSAWTCFFGMILAHENRMPDKTRIYTCIYSSLMNRHFCDLRSHVEGVKSKTNLSKCRLLKRAHDSKRSKCIVVNPLIMRTNGPVP